MLVFLKVRKNFLMYQGTFQNTANHTQRVKAERAAAAGRRPLSGLFHSAGLVKPNVE